MSVRVGMVAPRIVGAVVLLSVIACTRVHGISTSAGARAGRTGLRAGASASALRPPVIAGVTWKYAPTRASGKPTAYVGKFGGKTWLMWMNPHRLHFRFVPGTQEPAGSPFRSVDRQPRSWLSRISVAFNGGFKMNSHAGGYFYDGHPVSPLRAGLASLVFNLDGSMNVGVWGRDFTSTDGVMAVRQNLRPLVDGGVAQAHATDDYRRWGIAIKRDVVTNRSAVMTLADGSLMYVEVRHMSPDKFASELVRLGARFAIQLDINGRWPVGVVYRHEGASVVGTRLCPEQLRPGSVYDTHYERDFIAAIVPSNLWSGGK